MPRFAFMRSVHPQFKESGDVCFDQWQQGGKESGLVPKDTAKNPNLRSAGTVSTNHKTMPLFERLSVC